MAHLLTVTVTSLKTIFPIFLSQFCSLLTIWHVGTFGVELNLSVTTFQSSSSLLSLWIDMKEVNTEWNDRESEQNISDKDSSETKKQLTIVQRFRFWRLSLETLITLFSLTFHLPLTSRLPAICCPYYPWDDIFLCIQLHHASVPTV